MIIIIKYLKIKIINFRNYNKNYNYCFNKMYYMNFKEWILKPSFRLLKWTEINLNFKIRKNWINLKIKFKLIIYKLNCKYILKLIIIN